MALTLHGTVADNTAVLSRPNAKPLIINGNMRVKQRGDDITGITSSGYYSVDRMKVDLSDNGTWTHSQDTSNPGLGLTRSWKLDCTTADTSVAAGSFHLARYLFEGQDLQLLEKGTSTAQAVTISFWIQATVTGTYIAELFDVNNSRQISQAYTVSSANTWEKKVLSFVADTTGELTNGSGSSFGINLWLGAGSNFSSGTLSTTWTSSTNANRAVGQVNSASSTDNNVYFTGLQMEVGDYDVNSIPPFQHESFGDNLSRCQRYLYDPLRGSASFGVLALGVCLSTTIFRTVIFTPAEMRTRPTIVTSGTIEVAGDNFSPQVTSTAVSVRTGTQAMEVQFNVGSGLTSGEGAVVRRDNNDTAQFRLDAEL